MRLFEGTPWDRPPRCERCGELDSDCRCVPEPPARIPPGKQIACVSLEKRKRGKTVTLVRGLLAQGDALPNLLKHLKNVCGAGGTLHDDVLEIQGDQRDRVCDALETLQFRVKRQGR